MGQGFSSKEESSFSVFYTDGDASSVEGGIGAAGDGRGIAELLLPQYVLLTGGRSRDGCPLLTFPDNSNFHTLTSQEYQRLLFYLTSVPSLQEADLGFHLIVDRRKDRWNSVKTVLLRISEFFPGIIHAVYVLRPSGILQKISEVTSKFFKEDFKFKVIVCSGIEEIYDYVERSQLTGDLGGTLPYSHPDWIQQRIILVMNQSEPDSEASAMSDAEPSAKSDSALSLIPSKHNSFFRESINLDADDIFDTIMTKLN